ncbi:hypothetical protein [Oceanobacillus massiliensis]|uniref:hypothetical protein n=1 Tax=Oceanobacillus massiliensis TaxID=1465765 RepID=UPI0002E2B356|nr:hypothetical protein [Oceanobacillus massiliensis]
MGAFGQYSIRFGQYLPVFGQYLAGIGQYFAKTGQYSGEQEVASRNCSAFGHSTLPEPR